MHSTLKKTWLLAALAAASTMPVVAPVAADVRTPATVLAGCGAVKNAIDSGGQAKWTVHCSATQIWIEGWVTDTAADGKCAWVSAEYANGSTWASSKACPKNQTDNFSSPPRDGRIIDAYLHVG